MSQMTHLEKKLLVDNTELSRKDFKYPEDVKKLYLLRHFANFL